MITAPSDGLVLVRLFLCALVRIKCHKVGVVHDPCLCGTLHEMPLGRMRCNDVADFVRYAALQGQSHSRKGMSQRLTSSALSALSIRTQFVLQQLPNVRKD